VLFDGALDSDDVRGLRTAHLVTPNDLAWLLKRVETAPDLSTRRRWAAAAGSLGLAEFVASENIHLLNSALLLMARFPDIAYYLGIPTNPVALASPEADRMRDIYDLTVRSLHPTPLLSTDASLSTREKLDVALIRVEQGETNQWRIIVEALDSAFDRLPVIDLRLDLETTPEWINADPETQSRILDAGRAYLCQTDPRTDSWRGSNTWCWDTARGLQALSLIRSEDPSILDSLGEEEWGLWGQAVAEWPIFGDETQSNCHRALICEAYRRSPDSVIKALKRQLDRANASNSSVHLLQGLKACWDNVLTDHLREWLSSHDPSSVTLRSTLRALLSQDTTREADFAEAMIVTADLADEPSRLNAAIAAACLLQLSTTSKWPDIWPKMLDVPEFGDALIDELIAFNPFVFGLDITFTNNMADAELADLYVWLVQRYPRALHRVGGGFVTREDLIADLKGSVIRRLSDRGTFAAARQIDRIIHELPGEAWLDRLREETLVRASEATWIAPSASHIMRLVTSQTSRIVQNGEQLLDLLIESLGRLQSRFHGATPTVRDVWDRVSTSDYRPNDENDFSNHVKAHLEYDLVERGVVLNREVQIRRGQEADIHVVAVGEDHTTQHHVIIEVKGIWHRELEDAMETQLLNRYLKNVCPGYGLYLIGWFASPLWTTENDYRHRDAKRLTNGIDRTRIDFERQAANLSSGSVQLRAFVLDASLPTEYAKGR